MLRLLLLLVLLLLLLLPPSSLRQEGEKRRATSSGVVVGEVHHHHSVIGPFKNSVADGVESQMGCGVKEAAFLLLQDHGNSREYPVEDPTQLFPCLGVGMGIN